MRLPRAGGVLLHPTSLPGPHGSGDFGADAYHWIDWLAAAGCKLWQVLPLGPVGPGHSPYMSSSAHAGNPLLVDLADLQRQGWLEAGDLADAAAAAGVMRPDSGRIDPATVTAARMRALERGAQRFAEAGTPEQRADFDRYAAEHAWWLDDYALFMALSEANPQSEWHGWEPPLVRREPRALAAARERHAGRIAFWRFCQWRFDRQWEAVKAYANGKGVRIVGDLPIFVALHSAEAWAHQSLFELDADGRPAVVAGVPPDYFSATGQRWGNPLYRWPAHARDGYAWWIARVRRAFELADIVRIDHFRGFSAYWEIDAAEPTAERGRWVPGPGAALFDAVSSALGPLPVVAEDLGIITPDVDALRKQCGFPGMRVLQFAFDSGASNRYLPHHHEPDSVVYTGTHDNDTVAGWWAAAGDVERHYARGYLGTDGHDMAWSMIRAAFASVADTAIVPMQDVLALPTECRMNHPGQATGWWRWRLRWEQVQPWHAARLGELARLYGR